MTERPNVRRLQVPKSAEEGRAFGLPHLSAGDWGLIRHAEIEAQTTNAGTLVRVAALERQLPDTKYTAEISDRAWHDIHVRLEQARQERGNWWNFLRIAAAAQVVDPDKKPLISPEEWKSIESRWREYRTGTQTVNGPRAFVDMILQMKILGHEPILTNEDWAYIDQHIADDASIEELALIKTFAPERVPRLSKAEYGRARGYLDHCRQEGKAWGFLEGVLHLSILSADEVKITKHGLEITMKKSDNFKDRKEDQPAALEL